MQLKTFAQIKDKVQFHIAIKDRNKMHSMEKPGKASRKLWHLTWTLIILLLWHWGKGSSGNIMNRGTAKGKNGLCPLSVGRKAHEKEHYGITLERYLGAKL